MQLHGQLQAQAARAASTSSSSFASDPGPSSQNKNDRDRELIIRMIKNPLTVFVSVLLPRGVVGTSRGWQQGAKKGLTRMRPSQEGRKEPDHVGRVGGRRAV